MLLRVVRQRYRLAESPHTALLCKQEGNPIVDIFFAQQPSEVIRHWPEAEALHHVSRWVHDGLSEVFHGGQFRHAVTGALGIALETGPRKDHSHAAVQRVAPPVASFRFSREYSATGFVDLVRPLRIAYLQRIDRRFSTTCGQRDR